MDFIRRSSHEPAAQRVAAQPVPMEVSIMPWWCAMKLRTGV